MTITLEPLIKLLLPPVSLSLVNSTSTTNINGNIYLDTNLNLLLVNILITVTQLMSISYSNKHNKTHQHSREFFFILRYTNEYIIIIIVKLTKLLDRWSTTITDQFNMCKIQWICALAEATVGSHWQWKWWRQSVMKPIGKKISKWLQRCQSTRHKVSWSQFLT